jgi:hypothetical protein
MPGHRNHHTSRHGGAGGSPYACPGLVRRDRFGPSTPPSPERRPPLPLSDTGARRRPHPCLAPLGLALLHLALALGAYNPTPYVGGDNGSYLALARSLLEHGRLIELWDPALRPQALYPPLFPAVLALGMAAGLRTYVSLKYVVIAFSTLGVLASYGWMRRVAGPRLALVGGLWMAAAPGLLELSHWVLSDVPFWAITTVALWAFAHVPTAVPADGPERRRAFGWIAAGALATLAAAMTRSAGLPLVLAAAGWLALHRDWRAVLLYAGIVWPPMRAWTLLSGGSAAGGARTAVFPWAIDPYRPDYGNLGALAFLRRLVDNTAQYAAHHLPRLLTGTPAGRMAAIVGTAVALLAFAGWLRRVRRPGAAEVWVPVYVGLILAWPQNWSGERLILPVLPVLVLYATDSARVLALRAAGGFRSAAGGPLPAATVAAACAAVLLLSAPGAAREVRLGRECSAQFRAGEPFPCLPPLWHDFFLLGRMTRGKLPPGTVVISRKPTLWYMESGYRSRVYPFSAAPESFFAAAREVGAAYVVEDNFIDLAPIYLHPILRARPRAFCEVPGLALPGARLLRILPDTAPPLPGDALRGEEAILPCGSTAPRAPGGRGDPETPKAPA